MADSEASLGIIMCLAVHLRARLGAGLGPLRGHHPATYPRTIEDAAECSVRHPGGQGHAAQDAVVAGQQQGSQAAAGEREEGQRWRGALLRRARQVLRAA